jgi:hypothetical protein
VADLKAELARLAHDLTKVSDDIKRESAPLIPVAADRLVSHLQSRYPLSNRRNRPPVPHMRDDFRTRTLFTDPILPKLKVTGPRLAAIWQDGTVDRATRIGARRGRGPANDPGLFERTAVDARRQMVQAMQAMADRSRSVG